MFIIDCPTREIFEDTIQTYDLEIPKCRICGKPIWYHNNSIKLKKKGFEIIGKPNAFSTKKYDKEYSLTICEECLMENYPELKEKKNTIAYYNGGMDSIRFGYEIPKDIFDRINSERYGITKKKLIDLHGLEEGTKKWEAYCQKQKETNEFEYKKEKYGWSEEDFKQYNKSRACTINTFISRYGEEEGIRRWNDYCERQRETCTKEYWIEKLGEEEGLKKFASLRKSLFDNMKHLKANPYSKIAAEMFDELSKYFPNHKIFYAKSDTPDKEWIFSKDENFYRLDYFDLDLKIAVEFYGDFWHQNPNKYSKDNIRKVGKTRLTAEEIWKRDKVRIKNIEEGGIKVFIIWESQYKSNREKTIKELVELINNFKESNNG